MREFRRREITITHHLPGGAEVQQLRKIDSAGIKGVIIASHNRGRGPIYGSIALKARNGPVPSRLGFDSIWLIYC